MILDQRLREILAPRGATDKRMFGGTCFLINGNMAIGTFKEGLIVRVGKDAHAKALARPGTATFSHTGRPMEGFITVEADAVKSDHDLRSWVDLALAFVIALPKKDAAKPAKKRKNA